MFFVLIIFFIPIQKGLGAVTIGGDVGMYPGDLVGVGIGGVHLMIFSWYEGVRARWGYLKSILPVLVWSLVCVTVNKKFKNKISIKGQNTVCYALYEPKK